MEHASLNDYTISQQAELLCIAGRLLSLWYMQGKTEIPEGYGTLHNFAMATAMLAVDFYEYEDGSDAR
jgi:hypothetical protein